MVERSSFDKSTKEFPIKEKVVFLNHCGVSPLYKGALEREYLFAKKQAEKGAGLFEDYGDILGKLHNKFAKMLRTKAQNISFITSTAQGLNLIANGYPIEKGDQILSYIHEFPSNHYPWALQQKRGAELILLPNISPISEVPASYAQAWSFEDLERSITPKTKIIALSHVQFTSGFAANLKRLSSFSASRNIDLVIDAAQSLGVFPLYPEELGISAVCSSGWKWLLGPLGAGILYTSPSFREKLETTMSGPMQMKHWSDFLNHSWDPFECSRRFEYSTMPLGLAEGLGAPIEELFLRYGMENIQSEIQALQKHALSLIDRDKFTPLVFDLENRSGILSLFPKLDAEELSKKAKEKGVICTARGGYLRIAPHFYNSEEELEKAINILNRI